MYKRSLKSSIQKRKNESTFFLLEIFNNNPEELKFRSLFPKKSKHVRHIYSYSTRKLFNSQGVHTCSVKM